MDERDRLVQDLANTFVEKASDCTDVLRSGNTTTGFAVAGCDAMKIMLTGLAKEIEIAKPQRRQRLCNLLADVVDTFTQGVKAVSDEGVSERNQGHRWN